MKLIIGLGNPGKQYETTRHNAGFIAIEHLSQELNIPFQKIEFNGIIGKGKWKNEDVILLKPQTFMNLSGQSVIQVCNFFKITPEDIIVMYDDIEIPVGKIKVRKEGSAGGQNGMKSIIQVLGTQNFKRVRIGIGKDERMDLASYVIGKFAKEQIEPFKEAVVDACEAVKMMIVNEDIEKVMAKFN